MKKRLIILIFLLTTIPTSIFPQSDSSLNSIGKIFVSDIEHFFNLGIELAKSPFSFSANDWYTTGAVLGGTALLFTVDKGVRTFALSNQFKFGDKIFGLDKYYGDPYTALFTSAIYGYGLFTENHKIRKLGLQASEALIYATIITDILKIAIGRRRPFAGEDHLYFQPIQFTDNTYQSLPSGHTTVVFAVSTVIANYMDNIYWKMFWYGSASIVGTARIYHNKHWLSDVFLGASIGYFVGRFVVNFDKKENEILGKNITPYFTFNTIGVTLSF